MEGSTLIIYINVSIILHAILQEYVKIFEPMLLEECASQLTRGEETADVSLSHLAVVATLKEVRLFNSTSHTLSECALNNYFSTYRRNATREEVRNIADSLYEYEYEHAFCRGMSFSSWG